MVQRKMMKNLEIYNTASALLQYFGESLELPVKVNFYLQKNITSIVAMAREIDETRSSILSKYGTLDEEAQQYSFGTDEAVANVNKELTDLFELEQEVKVNMLKLDWFEDVNLSTEQVNAITYMIEDEEE